MNKNELFQYESNVDLSNKQGIKKIKLESNEISNLHIVMNENSDSQINERSNNINKLFFFKFVMYNTNIENNYSEFQYKVFWISTIECIIFVLSLILISIKLHGYTFAATTTHLLKSVIGFLILRNAPATDKVIENLDGFENNTYDEINRKLEYEFNVLIERAEQKLKVLMVIYFILNITCLILDIVLLGVTLGKMKVIQIYLFDFLILICFLSKLNIILVMLLSNIFWKIGLSNSFNEDKVNALKLMTIGYFADVKVIIKDISNDLATKAKNKFNNLRNNNVNSGQNV